MPAAPAPLSVSQGVQQAFANFPTPDVIRARAAASNSHRDTSRGSNDSQLKAPLIKVKADSESSSDESSSEDDKSTRGRSLDKKRYK